MFSQNCIIVAKCSYRQTLLNQLNSMMIKHKYSLGVFNVSICLQHIFGNLYTSGRNTEILLVPSSCYFNVEEILPLIVTIVLFAFFECV